MSDFPLPQPMTIDEQAADHDWLFDNYESESTRSEWQRALDWAHKGDFKPLAECLRRVEVPLNNNAVRLWLANGLESGFKKPRKTAKRPTLVPFRLDDVSYLVDERHLKALEAIKRVRELQAQGYLQSEAISTAAQELEITDHTLGNDLRRPYKHWGISDPKLVKKMFGSVIFSENEPNT